MDCIAGMRMLPSASVDAIVTDPPYELGFMGKTWDASGVAYSVEMWREALRVLKPGGHLLAFSGSRTYHRMTCAIEDAGFEVRDQIMWVYGSGFPKSLDVSKAIDKAAGAERTEVIGKSARHNSHSNGSEHSVGFQGGVPDLYAPATDAARQWQGWGTALKPAHEPICVARKPLIGTVAANVLAHGTGAINVDGCRVAVDASADASQLRIMQRSVREPGDGWGMSTVAGDSPQVVRTDGRWPANLIHDGSDEVLAAFPQAPGQMAKASTSDTQRAEQNIYGAMVRGSNGAEPRVDAGSAARFFYCAKASKTDRNEGCDELPQRAGGMVSNTSGQHMTRRDGYEPPLAGNHHPTVKPTDLMRYLCRLITPPGGTILDPFAGSGSTGKGAVLEGFNFIGFELSAEYAAIANARIQKARHDTP